MDDVRAVMDAVAAGAPLFGISEGGAMSMLFAATYPDGPRADPLGTYAAFSHLGLPRDRFGRFWTRSTGPGAGAEPQPPSRRQGADERFRQWWARFERLGASPRPSSR